MCALETQLEAIDCALRRRLSRRTDCVKSHFDAHWSYSVFSLGKWSSSVSLNVFLRHICTVLRNELWGKRLVDVVPPLWSNCFLPYDCEMCCLSSNVATFSVSRNIIVSRVVPEKWGPPTNRNECPNRSRRRRLDIRRHHITEHVHHIHHIQRTHSCCTCPYFSILSMKWHSPTLPHSLPLFLQKQYIFLNPQTDLKRSRVFFVFHRVRISTRFWVLKKDPFLCCCIHKNSVKKVIMSRFQDEHTFENVKRRHSVSDRNIRIVFQWFVKERTKRRYRT